MNTAWIIDDDKIVCKLVSTMLSAKGFSCEVFNSRQDIIEDKLKLDLGETPRPTLVLIDLQLGEDQGVEVYKEILEILPAEDSHKIKFVFMSSNSREESEEFHGIEEDNLFLQKPFKSVELNEILGM